MNQYAHKFPIENWPHKINLDDYPHICNRLEAMAKEQLASTYCSWLQQPYVNRDKRLEWRYEYIDKLGNDAFLEINLESHEGWVVFNDDAEIVTFILTHS